MKAYGGVDIYIHVSLTSAVAEGEWPLYPQGKSMRCGICSLHLILKLQFHTSLVYKCHYTEFIGNDIKIYACFHYCASLIRFV
jgi:hypothetical protein